MQLFFKMMLIQLSTGAIEINYRLIFRNAMLSHTHLHDINSVISSIETKLH